MSKKNKGFTLAELLVVVAIIAVLAAIAIPVFAGQLEKSREAVDLANARSAYAEVMTAAMTEDTSSPLYKGIPGYYLTSVTLTQAKDGWTTKTDGLAVGGVAYTDDEHWLKAPKAKGTCTVYFEDGQIYIDWGGGQKKPLPLSQSTYISKPIADRFLTKDILSNILEKDGSKYKYNVINSNEPVEQNEGTKLFLDYAAEKGLNLANYGAATWQIYAKNSSQMLDIPAIYWSTVEASSVTVDTYIPVIGYRPGIDNTEGTYDVYMAKVVRYNGGTKNEYYSIKNDFANVTNGSDGLGGSASFQFADYDTAMAKYNEALTRYIEKGSLSDSDMKALDLKD